MSTDLVQAAWSAADQAVVGTIQPQSYGRQITTMALQGPANTTLRIYKGYQAIPAMLMSSVFPADNRSWDSSQSGSLVIGPGEAVLFAWTGGKAIVGATATATVNSKVR